jgi:hypothetical protein
MFESTNWVLVESSNDDTNKYDNICPTIVTWTPEVVSKDEFSTMSQDGFAENKVSNMF